MVPALRVFAVLLLSVPLAAQLELAPVFGRHMVLQRDAEVPVFGTAAPGAVVEVRATWPGAAVARGRADADGRFRIPLRTPPAGGPFELVVGSGPVVLRVGDVLVGEVWICSGQSNMEWPVRRAAEAEREIAAADHPRIRLLTVPNVVAAAPRDRFGGDGWRVCGPDTVESFSAVGYAFGRALERELDVPVGLISADWGGTPAEAWTPAAALQPFDDFAPALATLAELAADPAAAEAAHARALHAWQRAVDARDPGLPGVGRPVGWAVPGLDDGGWDEVDVPGPWEGNGLGDYDGVAWYRRTVDIPAAWDGRALELRLGTIDDADRTFFAGTPIGATEGWTTERSYTVPARLVRAGRTTIAVRVHDTGGEGGFRGADDALRIFPVGAPDAAVSLAGRWKLRRGVEQRELPPAPRRPAPGAHTPSALWNGMVAPLVPFAVQGVIWYQGESNVGRAEQYERLFPALIEGWRTAFGRGDFPFLYVQIAPFAYADRPPEAPAELRDAQRRTLDAVPQVGMAVTMDVGDPRDIHPRDKVTVGERLAKLALANAYGKDLACTGPLPRSVVREGDALRVAFANAAGLATRDGAAPSHFEVAGADGVFHAARASIDGETVVVRSAAVEEPVHVRYAWGAADQPNLVDGAGLPATSFRLSVADVATGAAQASPAREPRRPDQKS